VTKWRDDVNSKVVLANDEPIPVLLLANKCDIPGVTIDKETLDQFVKDQGFIGWFPTSAQNNTNIDEGMKYLVERILDVAKNNVVPQLEEDTIQLESRTRKVETPEQKKNTWCCLQEF